MYVSLTVMPDEHQISSCTLALSPLPADKLAPAPVDRVLSLFSVWRGFVDTVNRAVALGARQARGYHVRARTMEALREALCDSATDARDAHRATVDAALPLAAAVHAELQRAVQFLLLCFQRPADPPEFQGFCFCLGHFLFLVRQFLGSHTRLAQP